MYRLASFFQSRVATTEPTVEPTSFKDAAHSPSIAISLTANSKPQLGYNGGYSSLERNTSTSRLSKIWTRFNRRSTEDVPNHEDETLSPGLYESKITENSVASLGVTNKPPRMHPFRRHTINLLKNDEEDSIPGTYCTDQVALLSNTTTEPCPRSPSAFRRKPFLQRKSRPPLISTASDSNIDWYYPSTPSPVEVEISVEVVSRPAVVLPGCPEDSKIVHAEQGYYTRDENSTNQDFKKFKNPFDSTVAAENSIKETIPTRRKNKSRASLPNISTDLATILATPNVVEPSMTRPLNVNTGDENIPDLMRMSKDMVRKSGQRKANSTMQAEAVSNSMRKNFLALGKDQNEEDKLDADGTPNIPSSGSHAWSDTFPDSPVIPSAPPPSPWAMQSSETYDNKEPPSSSLSIQLNPWISVNTSSTTTYPVSSPTTVQPQFFGQHTQQYTSSKVASPSPLGMARKGSLLGLKVLDSPSLESMPPAPPCTPCTPFWE